MADHGVCGECCVVLEGGFSLSRALTTGAEGNSDATTRDDKLTLFITEALARGDRISDSGALVRGGRISDSEALVRGGCISDSEVLVCGGRICESSPFTFAKAWEQILCFSSAALISAFSLACLIRLLFLFIFAY